MTPCSLYAALRPPAASTRLPATGLLCAVVLLLHTTPASARDPDPPQPQGTPAEAVVTEAQTRSQPAGQGIREGTELINQPGYFAVTGDRVTFFTADGTGRFVGLENLNLDRIMQAIARHPAQLHWHVTGTITEYRGANFLLVRRAILASERTPSQKGLLRTSPARASQLTAEPLPQPASKTKTAAEPRGG